MSSVGFVPSAVKEIETLREAWKILNDLLKNLANAEACLQKHDLQLTAVHKKGCEVERGPGEENNRGSGTIQKPKGTVEPASRIGGYLTVGILGVYSIEGAGARQYVRCATMKP